MNGYETMKDGMSFASKVDVSSVASYTKLSSLYYIVRLWPLLGVFGVETLVSAWYNGRHLKFSKIMGCLSFIPRVQRRGIGCIQARTDEDLLQPTPINE